MVLLELMIEMDNYLMLLCVCGARNRLGKDGSQLLFMVNYWTIL